MLHFKSSIGAMEPCSIEFSNYIISVSVIILSTAHVGMHTMSYYIILTHAVNLYPLGVVCFIILCIDRIIMWRIKDYNIIGACADQSNKYIVCIFKL